ncbi:hypothetical protein TRFO_01317 [Tritrichomonas foetus]|uniref:DUF3447 domain-containing protein n=1 Tax=Tritrichomonas foetus TaxID=1144522 RepID=A0A1J4KCJ8_9EUKA|nr:hypothetical protein TRFO_01317 [Tritrichomonas foetus]|eukprot:OHT07181.1 hypothetical protein TRFO_01317 [Tritrichomonas foetus]
MDNFFADFKDNIDDLSFLSQKIFDYFENIDDDKEEEVCDKLIYYIKRKNIKEDQNKYSSFLHFLAFASLVRPYIKNINQKVIKIINILIEHFELASSFIPKVIFDIFIKNHYIILHLLQRDIIPIDCLKRELNRKERFIHLWFFLPEMMYFPELLSNKDFAQKCTNWDKCCKDIKKSRDNIINVNDLALVMIQNDDIEQFIQFASQTNLDINTQIENIFNLGMMCDFSLDLFQNLSLIECSMLFGSLQIFKYLLLNYASISDSSLKYAIIGGNYEIIHLLENHHYIFNKECIEISIIFHQQELYEYLVQMKINKNQHSISRHNLVQIAISNFNFRCLQKLLNEFQSGFLDDYQKHEMMEFINPSSMPIFIEYLLKKSYIDLKTRTTVLFYY